jgi:hypothetical protein
LEEPPSLLALQAAVADLLPRVDLPDVLLEVAGWTGFLTEFAHVSEGTARAEDLGPASAPSWSRRPATPGSNLSCSPAAPR